MINFIDHLHFYSWEWLCRKESSALFCLGSIVLLRRHCTALMWMKSYLNDRTQRVAVGSVVSNAMQLQCSVSQSSVLGPCKCIFAKPISESYRRHNFSHQSYADDTQVYLVIKPLDNWKNISRRLETWGKDGEGGGSLLLSEWLLFNSAILHYIMARTS